MPAHPMTQPTTDHAARAAGFNPFNLTAHEVGAEYGWYLLNEGDVTQDGDGFWHPDTCRWIAWNCRPDILHNNLVHTWPIRRRREDEQPA